MKIDIEYIDLHYGTTRNNIGGLRSNVQRVHTDAISFDVEAVAIAGFGIFLDKDTFIPPAAILRITRVK